MIVVLSDCVSPSACGNCPGLLQALWLPYVLVHLRLTVSVNGGAVSVAFVLIGQGERTAVFPSDLRTAPVVSLCSTAIPKISLKSLL